MRRVVDHIAGETFHGRRGAVENAFKYGIDYVMVDAEAGLRRTVDLRAKPRRVPVALGQRSWWSRPRRGGARPGRGRCCHRMGWRV
jgi:hypothetical protein